MGDDAYGQRLAKAGGGHDRLREVTLGLESGARNSPDHPRRESGVGGGWSNQGFKASGFPDRIGGRPGEALGNAGQHPSQRPHPTSQIASESLRPRVRTPSTTTSSQVSNPIGGR